MVVPERILLLMVYVHTYVITGETRTEQSPSGRALISIPAELCECAVLGSCIFLFRMHSYRHSHIAIPSMTKEEISEPM